MPTFWRHELLKHYIQTSRRMKVLYISNRPFVNKHEALTWFQLYCDNDSDLRLETNFNYAKGFLTNTIIDKQKHLDFIITDWNIYFQNASTFLNWIRESKDSYSDNNFQFRSIPVLLIEDTINQSSFISEGFDGVVKDFPNNHFQFRQTVKTTIRTWRYSLANDLDLIGLDPQTQKNYSDHRSNFISYYKLKVLTRKFVDNKSKNRLNYIWTNSDLKSLHDSNQAFDDKIIWTRKSRPKYLEKEFHQFFLSNPTFIKGEDFIASPEQMLYEKHLYKNGTKKYDEPDFINKPHNYALRHPEVFEIKRHTQRLLRYSKDNFLSKTKDSFRQVKRYKEYMTSENPLNQFYIKLYLGKLFESYEYTLLIGSYDEKKEHEDLIERLKSDFEFDDINLTTYEELLQRHIRLCNRLSDFNIF